MENVKGIAKIEFFDKKGEKVCEVNEENLITNTFSNIIDFNNTLLKNPNSQNGAFGKQIAERLTSLEKFIGGILLFDKTLPEDPAYVNHDKRSNASAGTKYDLSNQSRGSRNEQESGPVNINGKQAYRLVWDFGTNNANITFNSICLTTSYAGDRLPVRRTFTADCYGNNRNLPKINRINGNTGFGITNDGEAIYIDTTSNVIKKSTKKQSMTVDTLCKDLISFGDFPINNYTELSKNFLIEGNELVLIAKKVSDNKIYLLRLNIKTNTVATEEELVGVTMYGSREFGLIGDNQVWIIQSESGAIKYRIYDKTSKTFAAEKRLTNLAQYYSHGSIWNLTSIKCNGKYIIVCGSVSYSSWVYTNSSFIFSETEVESYGYESSSSYNSSRTMHDGGPIIFNDATKAIGALTTNSGTEGYTVGPLSPEPLFTINNLAQPVTKTEANSMKITYTLIYD